MWFCERSRACFREFLIFRLYDYIVYGVFFVLFCFVTTMSLDACSFITLNTKPILQSRADRVYSLGSDALHGGVRLKSLKSYVIAGLAPVDSGSGPTGNRSVGCFLGAENPGSAGDSRSAPGWRFTLGVINRFSLQASLLRYR